jgi:hypothetical protein
VTGVLGPERLDALTATHMALLANLNRDAKHRPRPFTTADFMPKWGRPQAQSPAQMLAIASTITQAMGGTIERSPAGG